MEQSKAGQHRFFELIPPGTKFNFVRGFLIVGPITLLAALVSIALYFVKGFNYGIDFTGGVEVRLEFKQEPALSVLRGALEEIGLKGIEITQFVIPGRYVYAVKSKGAVEQAAATTESETMTNVTSRILNRVTQLVGEGNVTLVSTDMVGPRVGAELRSQAFWAVIASLVAMLIYVGYRFEPIWAPGGIIAIGHDVVIVAGIFIALGKEFDLTILAALLTIAGYSINDTIIVYDRIRETRGRATMRRLALLDITNKAINETLSRTILTSGLTMLTVLSLWLLGGKIIEGFAFAMVCGIVIGTYSSIYIASPISLFLERAIRERRTGKKKAKRR